MANNLVYVHHVLPNLTTDAVRNLREVTLVSLDTKLRIMQTALELDLPVLPRLFEMLKELHQELSVVVTDDAEVDAPIMVAAPAANSSKG